MMATQDTSMMAQGERTKGSALRSRRRSRPLTAGQELLFFGISFAIAVVLQLVVLLNYADILDW